MRLKRKNGTESVVRVGARVRITIDSVAGRASDMFDMW